MLVDIHFNSEMFLLMDRVPSYPFTDGTNGLSCVQTSDVLLLADQVCHVFLGSVFVFEKEIFHLQIAGKLFLMSFHTRTIL